MSAARRVDVGPCSIVELSIRDLTVSDLAEWTRLSESQPDPGNPFMAPAWVLGWYRSYVDEADQRLLLIRQASNQQLIGVAPAYLQHTRVAGVSLATRLLPVGAGGSDTPFELPGVLTAAGKSRDVMRALTTYTLRTEAHWCETTLTPGQGWFEPEWVFETERPVSFHEARMARACVVLPLAPTWEQTRTKLKRNVKESIRRSQNRLSKEGLVHSIVRISGDALDVAAVDRFLSLHRARSGAEQAGVHHHDAYASRDARRYLREVLPELSKQGSVSLFELRLDGETLASQLALHTAGCSYVHSSGFDPKIWELGPVTLLHAALIQHAIERGDRIVNFSPGPNVSKLRWSEQLWVCQDFAYGAGATFLRWQYGTHLTASMLRRNVNAIAFARRNARKPGATLATPKPVAKPVQHEPASRVVLLESERLQAQAVTPS